MVAATDLNGRWKGNITTPDGNEYPFIYDFKVDGEHLTGTAQSPEGIVTLNNGRVSEDAFSFNVTVEGNDLPHTGKIAADTCELDIDFGGQSIHITLGRYTSK